MTPAGLVLISPGTDCYHPATVLALSAALAPPLHVGARNLLLRLSADAVDDPLDVFATHLVPGLVGLVYSKCNFWFIRRINLRTLRSALPIHSVGFTMGQA